MADLYFFLVDDDPQVLKFLERLLKICAKESESTKPFHVRTHRVPAEAIQDAAAVSRTNPQASFAVISDGDLSGLTGPKVVEAFRGLLGGRLRFAAICSGTGLQREAAAAADILFYSKPMVREEKEDLRRRVFELLAG